MIALAVNTVIVALFLGTEIHAYYNEPGAVTWILSGWTDVFDRLFLSIILTVIMFMQLKIASETLSEATARAIETAIDVGPIQLGSYQATAAMLMVWVLAPLASRSLAYFYRVSRHSPEELEAFWGESA
jgi:hypothetical protein